MKVAIIGAGISGLSCAVVASGKPDFTIELNCWQEWDAGYVKGTIISGNFDENTVIFWIDKSYCKNGYAYLVPFDSHKANLVLVVTNIKQNELDDY